MIYVKTARNMVRQKDFLYINLILSQKLRLQPLLPSSRAKWCHLHPNLTPLEFALSLKKQTGIIS